MEKEKTFLEKSKEVLNEMASEDIIYEEVLCGPLEEPVLMEVHLNPDKLKEKLVDED